MLVLWILFIGGIIVLPGSAMLALHWAVRNGELRNFQKIALSIFDEEEPVGQMTDHFPGQRPRSAPVSGAETNEYPGHVDCQPDDQPSSVFPVTPHSSGGDSTGGHL